MQIWIINGPNINLLGLREPQIYGSTTYAQLVEMIEEHCAMLGIRCRCLQSNHEGALVDFIQQAHGEAQGLVLNPAAYTHTSIALLDALQAVGLPTVEVHISNLEQRESFRQISYLREACFATISGQGVQGYLQAIDLLAEKLGS